MKKRIFAALLCVIMLFGMRPVTAFAADGEPIVVPKDKLVVDNGVLKGIEKAWLDANGSALLKLVVPSDLNVTEINSQAFMGNEQLVFVDLSDTKIETIGKFAFSECKNLETVILPNCLKNLGNPSIDGGTGSVFTDCNSIESIRTASSDEDTVFELPSSLTYIGYRTFRNCFADDVDAKVIIPETVSEIRDDAFYDSHISQIIVSRKGDAWSTNGNFADYSSSAFLFPDNCSRIIVMKNKNSYVDYNTHSLPNSVRKALTYPVTITFRPEGIQEKHLCFANLNYQLGYDGFWYLDNEYTLPKTGGTSSEKPGYDYVNAWYIQNGTIQLKENTILNAKNDTESAYANGGKYIAKMPTVSYIVDNQDVAYAPGDAPLQVTVGGSVGVKVDHPLLKEEGHYGTDEDYVYFKYCWWDEVGNEDFTNTVNGPRSDEEPELFSNAPSDREPNRVFVDSGSIPVTKLDHTRIDRSQYMVEIYGYHVKDGGEPELFYKSSENFIHFGSGDVEAIDGCYTLQVEVVERADPISTALTSLILVAGLDTDDHIAYVYGYPDGTVRPNGTITRAEVTTIFYRLLTSARRDEIFTSENSFRDVDSSMWYNKAASSMAAGGYIQGYADGTFGANKPITRAEFVCLAARFATKTTGFASYTDVDNGHWAARSIAICASNGWVQGYEDGTFRPDQPITRAEAMTIINRMLGRGVSKGYVCKGAARFTDNDPGSWYYYEILEATNDHEYRNARPFEQWIRATILRSYDMDKYERP